MGIRNIGLEKILKEFDKEFEILWKLYGLKDTESDAIKWSFKDDIRKLFRQTYRTAVEDALKCLPEYSTRPNDGWQNGTLKDEFNNYRGYGFDEAILKSQESIKKLLEDKCEK